MILTAVAMLIVSCGKEEEFDKEFNNDVPIEDQQETEGNSAIEGSLTLYRVTEDDISKIKDYSVGADLLPFQQDYGKHIQMWEFVSRLIPLSERDKIGEFEVFHGGNGLAGYVLPIDNNDLGKWRFALAIDLAENLESIDFEALFTYVTLHEYGHVLTLNDEQVQVSASDACPDYFTGEGCSRSNSYINRLYELGWKDIYNELDENNPEALYEKYKDRFVSDYAATNPGEDIAEVFAFFVTQQNKPSGNSIADQKIKLLYEFPELVKLRNEIRSNEQVVSLRAGSWRNNPMYSRFKVCGRKGCKH